MQQKNAVRQRYGENPIRNLRRKKTAGRLLQAECSKCRRSAPDAAPPGFGQSTGCLRRFRPAFPGPCALRRFRQGARPFPALPPPRRRRRASLLPAPLYPPDVLTPEDSFPAGVSGIKKPPSRQGKTTPGKEAEKKDANARAADQASFFGSAGAGASMGPKRPSYS